MADLGSFGLLILVQAQTASLDTPPSSTRI